MGVLRWPPDVVRNTTLADLHDAYLGYAGHAGLLPVTASISKEFMTDMLARFPDRKGSTG